MSKVISRAIVRLFGGNTEPQEQSESEYFESVLVIGKAKTGTTFLAKSIQNSLDNCQLVMEPKNAEFIFDQYGKNRRTNEVAKLIFEHWSKKSNLMAALLADELPVKYTKKVIIVRDPRDELVSRLLYLVKPLLDQGKLNSENLGAWLTILRGLESGTDKFSFVELVSKADELFETSFLEAFFGYLDQFAVYFASKPNSVFAIRYEDMIDQKVDHLEDYLGFTINFNVVEDEFIRRTKRSSDYGSWKLFFTNEDIAYFQPLMAQYMNLIGYVDWELDELKCPEAAVTSQYVERLATS